MAGSDLVQSLARGLELLRLVAASPEGMRLGDLAEASGLKVTTAHNLLRTLLAQGFLSRDAASRFVLGAGLFELAASAQDSAFRQRLAAALPALARRFSNDTVTVSCIVEAQARCVLRLSPERPGQLQRNPGNVFAPYTSTTAIVLQSYVSDAVKRLEKLHPFAEYGAGVWGSAANFAKTRALVRKQGYFLRHQQSHFTLALFLGNGHVLGMSGAAEETETKDRLKAAKIFARKFIASNAGE